MAIPSYPSGASAIAFDVRTLDNLKGRVQQSPDAAAGHYREVAKQFEALFLQVMLKAMREATPQNGLFDSDQTRLARSLADEQLAFELASPGIGLAQALLDMIQRQQGGADQGQGTAAWHAPEANTSRVPGRRSHIGAYDGRSAPSVPPAVSALLDMLAGDRAAGKAATAQGAPRHVVEFVSRMAGPAKAAERASGVPARLILGQAALESGWGQRELRHPDGRPTYNVFGIKATGGWQGEVVEVTTTEYENGVPRKVVEPFRAYGSYAEAFADYARLIGSSPRYRAVVQARNEVEAARHIQSAGYATDPRYAEKLIDVMASLGGLI